MYNNYGKLKNAAVLFWQDLMEREHRNQNSIEEERASLIKMKEVNSL